MKLTWMGTATFVLESGDQKILFDPFLELAGGSTAVSPEKLLQYDTIFVTHCHFDHLYEAEELIGQGEHNNTLFCTRQCCSTVENFLEETSNVVQIRVGQTYDLYSQEHPAPGEPGFIRIGVLQGRHIEFQYRHILDTLSPLRVDVKAEHKELLILGSLALDPAETYPEGVDVLILPYQGNNDLPARAEEVLSRLRPKAVVLSHFDNAFPPMSRDVDLQPLKKLMAEKFPHIKVVKPTAGKAIEL